MLKKVHVIASKTEMVFCEIKITILQNTEYLYSAKCWLSGVVVDLGLITLFLSQGAVVAISEDVITMFSSKYRISKIRILLTQF